MGADNMSKKSKIITGLGAASTLAAATDFFLCRTLFDQTLNRKKLKKGKQLSLADADLNDEQKTRRHKELLLCKKWIQNVAVDKVSVESEDGLQLVGMIYPSHDHTSHRWAFVLHDYACTKEDMRTVARAFHEQGYHVLTPDARAHGESEGSLISLGWNERKDLLRWIDAVLEMDSQAEIVLYGISMGADTILFCPQEKLPAAVRCIIEDGGYTSVYDILSWQMTHYYKMPPFPILDSMGVLVKQKMNFGIREASALPKMEKAVLPTLFLHGEKDVHVPCDMAFRLYDACQSAKDLYIVENSGHRANMYEQPKAYYQKIFHFLDEHMK